MDSVNFSTASLTLSSKRPPHNFTSFVESGDEFICWAAQVSNAIRAVELKKRFWGLGMRACLDGEKMGEVVKEEEEGFEEESNSDDSIDGQTVC